MRSITLALLLLTAVAPSAPAEDRGDPPSKDGPLPLAAPFDEPSAKAAQQAWTRHLGKTSSVDRNSIGMELVLIPPGKFIMGSPMPEEGRKDNEGQVEVSISKAFYLGKDEVTQGQWRAVMGTTPWTGQKGKEYVKEGDNYPALFVSWDDAQQFCKKLSADEHATYRLPTEAEWEYACRAGTTSRFSFGDDESKLAGFAWYSKNAWDNGEQYAHEVGLTQPNPFQLHDMHGNIREWCEDVYVDALPGGSDPLVSTEGSKRVYRGGGWNLKATYCRSASRGGVSPLARNCFFGFRVALSTTNK